jgi:uncharacterized protein
MKNQYSSSLKPTAELHFVNPRPWWREPYVWMVIGGPLSAVIACAITAVYILQGPDAIVPEYKYQEGLAIKKQVDQAAPPLQPAQMGRNHSATGGRQP